MKKIFLFAAAAIAALTVNARVVTFSGLIDKTDATTAKSTFDAAFEGVNIKSEGVANSKGDSYAAKIIQEKGTAKYDSTFIYLKGERQVYLTFKDKSDNKEIGKAWSDYIQANGKTMCLVIKDLKPGDQVKITLKEALSKPAVVEGAAESGLSAAETTLTAIGNEIRLYSNDGTDKAAWKLQSVEVPEGSQAIDNVEAAEKTVKFFENGQLVIIKNGVRYNALGAKL